MLFLRKLTLAKIIALTRGQKWEIYKNTSMIKSAQTRLGGMKEFKGSKMFKHTIKIIKMMMLTTKWRKQKEKPKPDIKGGTIDHFVGPRNTWTKRGHGTSTNDL